MIFGVMFYVEKDYPTSSRKFKELLKAVDTEKYAWKIDESDFYNCADLQNILVKKQIKSSEEILKELDCEVMMILIGLEGYKNKNDIEELDSSFHRYLESNCETVVFVADTWQFAVYSKNETVLNNAVAFASDNNTGRIELLNEENAARYFGV